MEIRPIRADEGLRLRDLRLRALADAPLMFGETLAQAQVRPEAFWHERAARNAAGIEAITFVAEEDGDWHGMVTGFFPPDDPHAVRGVNLWVDPATRGWGVGQALMEAVAGWAGARGASRLQHWITETNTASLTLCERIGFARTGKTKPLGSDPSLRAVHMVREL